ncbi:MAG: hypothetical protein D3908_15840 [Candidatus Electrothrix sp. AUS4]|nr:hypothetical protein [Candidatus Electrothrix sp. AUS4]
MLIAASFSFYQTNAFSKCMGTTDECPSITTDAQCRCHTGCSSSYGSDNEFTGCSGQAIRCDQLSDPASCFCQAGCYWPSEIKPSASCTPCVDNILKINHNIGELWYEHSTYDTCDIVATKTYYKCNKDKEGRACKEELYTWNNPVKCPSPQN